MNRIYLLLLILLITIIISSCDSSEDPMTNNPPEETKGNIYLRSNPAGAEIWIAGVNTTKTTPDTILNLDEGSVSVTLKLQDYVDTTFSVTVTAGETNVVGTIGMTSNIFTTLYGPVRIYETAGTDSTQPSGLDLSSGMAYGVSSVNKLLIDIYYSTEGTGGQDSLIQSANLYLGLIRETDFNITNKTNLFDHEDSPMINTGTWTNFMTNREDNYVFLYDHDGHYSKFKIVSWGGGVAGEPEWVEVQWYYNNTPLDTRFK